MLRLSGATAATLAGATPLAGCSGDGSSGNSVDMTEALAFDPDSITVEVGTTVTWENVGSVGHTVTAYGDELPADAAYFASGGFASEAAARESINGGIVESDESYTHTFGVAGEYGYFCVPHEGSGMTGTVRASE